MMLKQEFQKNPRKAYWFIDKITPFVDKQFNITIDDFVVKITQNELKYTDLLMNRLIQEGWEFNCDPEENNMYDLDEMDEIFSLNEDGWILA